MLITSMKLFRKKGANLPSDQTNTTLSSAPENNDTTKVAPVSEPKHTVHSKRTIVVVVSVIGVIILSMGLVFSIYNKKKSKDTVEASDACTSKAAGDILKQASQKLAPEKTKELKPYVDKIKTLKDYDKDPNCLYLVVVYDVNTHNDAQASQNYSRFNEVYNNKVGLDSKLSSESNPQENLKNKVDNLYRFKKELNSNVIYYD